ncbi:exopolysaccharide biosynthesis protein [Hellea balneolensis]|uniref:exopolysaccharide biosynthesis protein n=1 Tax=Hellea balneolensis TaxID=287478 RepID=UPI0003FC2B57|nr:exopolysaccharide biosynthesis protein [Hellea balneolensis]
MNAADTPDKPLEDILKRAREAAGGEKVDLVDLVKAFGDRAFGPVMILCSLFLMTPIGAIPGLPAAFGLVVIIFALQLLFRRPHPWMPSILRKVKISDSALEKTQDKVSPFLRKIDSVIRPRLPWVTSGPMQAFTALLAIILAATLLPLGMVPFGVVAPAFIIGLLGLGITARDGVLIIMGFLLSVGVAFGVTNLIMSGF